jgi:hypothetical protein
VTEREPIVGDIVETDMADEGRIVSFEIADDGQRIARVQHTADSPANPGGESLWAVDKLTRAG